MKSMPLIPRSRNRIRRRGTADATAAPASVQVEVAITCINQISRAAPHSQHVFQTTSGWYYLKFQMSVFKAFSQCSLSDLAQAISAHAATDCCLDAAAAERILPLLRNVELTQSVLRRHPLVLDFHRRHLVCTALEASKQAWCRMLRDLFETAEIDISDAELLHIYLVCKDCAEQPFFSFQYTDLFLGRSICILFKQHSQIEGPLNLIKAGARLYLLHQHQPLHNVICQPLKPVAYLNTKIWPGQRARVMFGLTATACLRLSTTSASELLYSQKTWRCRTCMLARVFRGYLSKIQVQPHLVSRHCRAAITPAFAVTGN
jgi:hypothetical protein